MADKAALNVLPADRILDRVSGAGRTNVLFAVAANEKAPKDILDIRAAGGYFAPVIHDASK